MTEQASNTPSGAGETETVGPPSRRADAAPTASLADSRLLRYLLIEELGRGGMGRVHRAYDPLLEREVALKEVLSRRLDTHSAERLVEEARAMARLSHPNVVAVHDVQVLDDVLGPSGHPLVVLVMELVEGETLSAWLQGQRRPWAEIVDRFRAAGQGLAAAHDAGILHRDVKPSNIMLPANPTVRAKVADFGLAVSPEGDASADVGERAGTPHYQPPEQREGAAPTASGDQYAFCVALREALTRQRLFEDMDELEAKRRGPPAWPSVGIPRRIAAAIDRGLSPRPEARWADMNALLAQLSPQPWFTRPASIIGVALASAGVTAAVVYAASNEAEEDPCGGASRHIAGVWAEPAIARGRAAFRSTGLSIADERWGQVERAIDRYASEWIDAHASACRATAVHHEQSEAALDLRMACLFDARASLRGAVEVFGDADARTVVAAERVLGGLPPIESCSDLVRLSEGRGTTTTELDPADEATKQQIATARAMRLANDLEAAEVTLSRAEQALEGSPHASLKIEALIERALLLEESGTFEAALAQNLQALEVAKSVRRWPDVGAAAASIVRLTSKHLRDPQEARRYEALALELATTPSLRITALLSVARLRAIEGEPDAAMSQLEAALEVAQALEGRAGAQAVLTVEQQLAELYVLAGDHVRAETTLEQAVRRSVERLGAGSPQVARLRVTLARVYASTSRPQSANEEFGRALAFFRNAEDAFSPLHMASVEADYAESLAAAGDYAAGRSEADAALGRVETLDADAARFIEAEALIAKAACVFGHGSGDVTEALDLQRAATRSLAELHPNGSPELSQAQWTLGRLLLADGRFAQAKPIIEKSLRDLAAVTGPDHPVIRSKRYALALAFALDGDPAAGIEEALSAWESLGDGPRWVEARVHTAMALAVGHALDAASTQASQVQGWVEEASDVLERHSALPGIDEDRQRVRRWASAAERGAATPESLTALLLP